MFSSRVDARRISGSSEIPFISETGRTLQENCDRDDLNQAEKLVSNGGAPASRHGASTLAPSDAVATQSWRGRIKVHPACELFPMMSPAELYELSEDIRKNGLASDIAIEPRHRPKFRGTAPNITAQVAARVRDLQQQPTPTNEGDDQWPTN